MKKILIGFVIGFILGSTYFVFAKSEQGSSDAESVVGYGYDGGSLVAIKVDSNGVLQTN